jgi:capsular polysaccharide biosynthesis protein
LQHGGGRLDSFEPPSPIDDSAPPDPFEPEIFVAVIPRARMLYDSGVVVSPDHRLLGDVSWEGESLVPAPQYHPIMSKLFLPRVKHLPGRVAVISSVKPDNYYHWMFDILPRFGIVQRGGLVPDCYVVNATTQFQKDSLKALNIPPERILSPTANTHIEADELIIPSLIGPVLAMSPQLQACQYLRSTFLETVKTRKPYRAIYITRADAGSRRVLNEADIRKVLMDNGFEVISLSNVPFLEQIQLFADARIIVGPHGAGFTNAVFCQPGSVLIEFMPERRKVDCFERMARLIGMRYCSIVSKESAISNAGVSNHDHTVDKAELSRLIRQFS